MKYANNHWWKFDSWFMAFWVGFTQMAICTLVEMISLTILLSSQTIMDILMNFLALVVLQEFDGFFFEAFKGDTTFGKALDGGEYDGTDLKTLTKIEVTTSWRAKSKIDNHKLRQSEQDGEVVVGLSAANNKVVPDSSDISRKSDETSKLIACTSLNIESPKSDESISLIEPTSTNESSSSEAVKKSTDLRPEYIYLEFSKRPTICNKFARIAYVCMYSIYCSFGFYFVPFAVIFLSYEIPYAYGPPTLTTEE